MTSEYVKKRVAELFDSEKFLCAETVVQVVAEAGGRMSDDLIRAATGFCSGMARTCNQCGAVTGAIMGIGLYAGRSRPGEDLDPTYGMVQEFLDRFTKKYRTINCFELIGCDFATPEGQKKYKEEGLREKCYLYAVRAADMALSILREHGYLPDEDAFVRDRLAPCGLVCGNCMAFAGGPIEQLSKGLRDRLGPNFAQYAKRFEFMNPIFRKYPDFGEFLDFLAAGSCTGCREAGCLFKACKVGPCAREHGVDYCFECPEFPCDRHGMQDRLLDIWRRNNERMRECGSVEFYNNIKDKPRYP